MCVCSRCHRGLFGDVHLDYASTIIHWATTSGQGSTPLCNVDLHPGSGDSNRKLSVRRRGRATTWATTSRGHSGRSSWTRAARCGTRTRAASA